MATTIKLKNSVTTTNAPSSLVQGEVAINITDKKVWVGNAATTPIQLLGDGGSASFTSIAFGAGTVSNPSITFTGDTNTGIYSPAADTIAFTEGGVESMRITSAGDVGIGTSSPAAKLHVNGENIIVDRNAGDPYYTFYTAGVASNVSIYGGSSNGFRVFTNSAERMRILSAGDVCIGTTSQQGSARLSVARSTAGECIRWTDGATGGAITTVASFGTNLNSDAFSFTTSSTERMRIDSSGNVAIGRTSSISYKLDVDAGAGSAARLLSNNAQVLIGYNSTSFNYYDADTQIFRNNAGTERMRIDSSGNVSIGTTTPGYLGNPADLCQIAVNRVPSSGVITNSARSAAFINLDGSSGGSSIQFATAAANNTNPTERMRIDASGNVSLGGAAATARLYLSIPSGDGTVNISGDGTNYAVFRSQGASFYQLGSLTSIPMTFITNGSERMRISSDGGLFIGCTARPTSATGGSCFSVQSSGRRYLELATTTTSTVGLQEFINGNGTVGSITVSGSATAYNTSSDYRLKENIAPMQGALSVIAQLKPCTYTWKVDGSSGQGFIAHELAEVIPQAVAGEKDAINEEGKPVYQGIDASFLVATLTAAIQEQQAMIEELKQEVALLKAK